MIRYLYLFIFVLLWWASTGPAAWADIYKCDGKWTNKPCSGQVEEQFKELSSAKPVPRPLSPRIITPAVSTEPLTPRYELIRQLKKESALNELRGGSALSKQELDTFSSTCLNAKNLEACQVEYNTLLNRLVAPSAESESDRELLGDIGVK